MAKGAVAAKGGIARLDVEDHVGAIGLGKPHRLLELALPFQIAQPGRACERQSTEGRGSAGEGARPVGLAGTGRAGPSMLRLDTASETKPMKFCGICIDKGQGHVSSTAEPRVGPVDRRSARPGVKVGAQIGGSPWG